MESDEPTARRTMLITHLFPYASGKCFGVFFVARPIGNADTVGAGAYWLEANTARLALSIVGNNDFLAEPFGRVTVNHSLYVQMRKLIVMIQISY